MIKEGQLNSVHLLQLLGEIFTERFTGAMRLESGSQVRILYFKNGDIVSCGTNVNTEKIDEVLLDLGKITRDHIREVLEMSASFSEIGKRMLALGFLSAAELDDALRHQTRLIVRNLIRTVDASFSLVENYTPTRTDIFHYPTHHFISDFLRSSDDRELIFSILPPPATRVKARPGTTALVDTLPWGTEEKDLVGHLNGRVSMAELTGLSRMREMDIYKLIAVLACLEAVEVPEGEEPSPPPPATLPLEPQSPFAAPAEPPPAVAQEPAAPALSSELFPVTRPGIKPSIGIPRTHAHKARSRRLFVVYPLALISVVLLGMVGLLAWQKLKPTPKGPPPAVVPAQPTPIVLEEPKPVGDEDDADMVLAPPTVAIPSPGGAGAGPTPAAQPSPQPEPKAAPPVQQPPPAASPAVKPEPRPTPAALPTPPPAAPAAPIPSGKLADAARGHLARIQGLPSSRYTLQLMIACQDDSIAKAQAQDRSGALWFIPFAFKGRSCYKVYWGDYSSAAAAQEAAAGLPEAFRGEKHQVVTLGAAVKNASP